ncbi:hypothetical protein GK047_21795 [Paenibacillus sp. SYP-B3998]|uniref:DUF4340 domain-containing protein n=1 Tax=Paenibacillus sp. SYP-B3998 TaxID=2678564 RepID=A0A6G4A2D4_9BACL|nr:hypothetical protein [Paenibacillus sp. SYP-B3998]NEW08633.1 hypothetical protein [Paenibacillus sp. SYP-B3998]
MMMKWTTWTAACLISVSAFLLAPIHTSALDTEVGTSQVQQGPTEVIALGEPRPSMNTQSEASFADTVNQWKITLSHERGFERWQQAAWNSYPLGPGTHGWVVILNAKGQDVGYMIVNAAENGSLRLSEYGTGDYPLFSLTTLYRSLVQQELISSTTSLTEFAQNEKIIKERLYMDSLTAIWKIKLQDQTYYLDAKSGELLPLHQDPIPKQAVTSGEETELSGKLDDLLLTAFDPYDRLHWVQGKPLSVTDMPTLKAALKQKNKLTYVAELYNNQVTLPLAVIGYKMWNGGEPYLAVDHVGTRYILLKEALEQGHLYA